MIEAYYIAPTNTKGSRVKARCASSSRTFGWQHNLSADENHKRAARFLRAMIGCAHRPMLGSTAADGRSVWLFVDAANALPADGLPIEPDPIAEAIAHDLNALEADG